MMNFDEFLEAAKDHIKEVLNEADVRIQAVNKLQGESYVGVAVRPEGASTAVTFNLQPAYERYQADETRKGAILVRLLLTPNRFRLRFLLLRSLPSRTTSLRKIIWSCR